MERGTVRTLKQEQEGALLHFQESLLGLKRCEFRKYKAHNLGEETIAIA